MKSQQTIVLVILFAGFAGFSAWLQQFAISHQFTSETVAQNDAPDYYIENFVSTGRDRLGKKYQLLAKRLVHYPLTQRAMLEQPHIIQYEFADAPRHTYAETGWLDQDEATALLYGNVRVVEGHGSGNDQHARAVTTVNKMLIRLNGE